MLHRPSWLATFASIVLACVAGLGCYRIPENRSAVTDVSVVGAKDLDAEDIEGKIATRPTSRFLGLFYGFVYDYELFDRYALERDLARVERWMHARGYYDAKVRVGRVVTKGDKVHVTIEVEEGEPVRIAAIQVVGDDALEARARQRLHRAIESTLAIRSPLDEDKLSAAEKAGLKKLTATGYAAATVTRHAEIDLATHAATVTFTVVSGPHATFGAITFLDLGTLPEDAVRRVFAIEPGMEFSSDEIDDSRQALLNLGVFGSVVVTPDLSKIDDAPHIVPLSVKCETSKLRTLLAGLGFEFDSLKTDLHGTVGWTHANFLGDLRHFELRDTPGIVLFPTRLPDVNPPKKVLFENKILATLRQPAFIERRTTGIARAEYDVYPVILPNQGDAVLGYHELHGAVGLERTIGKLLANPTYNFQANFPFDYLLSTPDVTTLLISFIDLKTNLDYRDDPLHTHRGFYIGNDLQVAGGPFLGDATDIRVQPEARGYLPISKRITFAARGTVGFLFPLNYGDAAKAQVGQPVTNLDAVSRDYQILFFRGFFGGGPISNRGYPLRGIGPHNVVPLTSPAALKDAGCDPSTVCNLPTGGVSLWEASLEVRFVISGPFATAFFVDTGDVSPYEVNLRFNRPHMSVGTGFRYDTPVGPIRLDVGYRIQGLQFPGGNEGEVPPADLLGAPIALSFGIGEAF